MQRILMYGPCITLQDSAALRKSIDIIKAFAKKKKRKVFMCTSGVNELEAETEVENKRLQSTLVNRFLAKWKLLLY